MAKYTIELRNVCDLCSMEEVEKWFKSYEETDYLTPEELNVISTRGTWSKNRLASKIVRHYYMNEIGYETPALFRDRVKIAMEEIMEEYLPLIYSASIKYDPLVNVDFVETFHQSGSGETAMNGKTGNTSTTTATGESNTSTESTNNSESNSTTTSSSSGLQVNSDTPQGQISKTAILGGSYASSTSANESEGTGTDKGTSKTTSTVSGNSTSENESKTTDSGTSENATTKSEITDYERRTKGNSGVTASAQKMIEQYRDNIRAIDREIIDRLREHFMGIY